MRDDFTANTIDMLAKRVGVRCSNPSCRRPTSGPRMDGAKVLNIGVAAHITAAAGGGPRYDATLTDDERRDSHNGIWLCQNCAKLIDNDCKRFTAQLLREWKAWSEAQALSALTEELSPEQEAVVGAEVSIKWKNVSINAKHHDYHLQVLIANRSARTISEFHVDLIFPTTVLKHPERHALYIHNRSDRKVSFFRSASLNLNRPVYPGDEISMIELDYFVDDRLYWRCQDLFSFLVSADLYCGAQVPLRVQIPFKELQCF